MLAALAAGCVSVDDFRQMSPAERAHFVCSKDREVRQLDADIDALADDIAQIDEALYRGYHLHTSCKQVPVSASTTSKKTVKSKCKPDGKGGEVCEETETIHTDPITEYHTVCEDIPVPIDVQFEKEKLRGYEWELDDAVAVRDEVYRACVLEIEPMSAEEAYDFYKGN